VTTTLTQCGLLKFYQCPFIRAQSRLLNALIDYWHLDAKAFMLEHQSLNPMIEDIYFLTGLSQRGDPINFYTFPSGPHNIVELIGLYCDARTNKIGTQVTINKINNLSLKLIVLLIGHITRSTTLHQASRAHMHYVVQCLNAQVFDWSMTLLDCMKRQLTECHMWRHRNFGFGTILCAFLFERVPSIIPQEIVRGHAAKFPAVSRWEALMPRQGGGRTMEAFDDKFSGWLYRHIPVIEYYPYTSIDFSKDPDMIFPLGQVRGEMGKFFLFS
jgi:hypothetical protein